MKIKVSNTNTPVWRNITVKTELPAKLKKLEELSKNLWWVWNSEAKSLFHDLDRDLWRATGENPVMVLQKMTSEQLSNHMQKILTFTSYYIQKLTQMHHRSKCEK